MQMSSTESAIFRLIKDRTSANPIKDGELAALARIGERDVTDTIKRLIEEHHIPIGASKEKPYGRYIIRTTDELDRYKSTLVATIASLSERIKSLDDAFMTYRDAPQQTAMEF